MRLLGIPEGLTNRKCEKCEPKLIGGYPPIRFIPEKAIEDEEVDGKKVNTVKVNINASVTKTFRAFAKGKPEAVIKLIRNHESLVGDKKLKEIYTSASALWNEKKKAIEEFATTSDKSRDKSQLKILNREMKEHKAACISCLEDTARRGRSRSSKLQPSSRHFAFGFLCGEVPDGYYILFVTIGDFAT